jgi:hypothetical protein
VKGFSMGMMKITDGPKYKKKGAPLQKEQQQISRIAALVFADLLPSMNETMPERVTKGQAQTAAGGREASDPYGVECLGNKRI